MQCSGEDLQRIARPAGTRPSKRRKIFLNEFFIQIIGRVCLFLGYENFQDHLLGNLAHLVLFDDGRADPRDAAFSSGFYP